MLIALIAFVVGFPIGVLVGRKNVKLVNADLALTKQSLSAALAEAAKHEARVKALIGLK